jgi:Rrf2 family protein
VLSLTRKTDYALVALAEIARQKASCASARDLASRLRVPQRLLTNVLSKLTHHGLVLSVRGVNGGYGLAKPAEEITLRELIEAVEGPVKLARCCDPDPADDGRPCARVDLCLNRESLQKMHDSFRRYLDQITLKDIAANTVPQQISP